MNTPFPDDTTRTLDLLLQFDLCFRSGFAGGQHLDMLDSLVRVFAGTPLSARLSEAAAALGESSFQERHFVALAAAHGALSSAAYDSLNTHVRALLGRTAPIAPDQPPINSGDDPLLSAARHWLMELAIQGFGRVDTALIMPFIETLAHIRQNPALIEAGALVNGFVSELLGAVPLESPDDAPVTRWGKLWSAAMLASVGVPGPLEAQPVSGTFYPLGIDQRQHAQMISLVAWGVLDSGGARRLVRCTRSAYKVEALYGPELWLLFPDLAPLLTALAERKALEVSDLLLLPTGDLLWQAEGVRLGRAFNLFDLAAEYTAPGAPGLPAPSVPALQRDPFSIAEPLLLRDYWLEGTTLCAADDWRLAVDFPESAEIGPDELLSTNRLFGLLRCNGSAWIVQPLTVGSADSKHTFVGESGLKLLKKPPKTSAVGILQERASRLLRKSARDKTVENATP